MKILAQCNALALAHVSRPLEIAKILRGRGHETVFAGHGKYLAVAKAAGFAARELPYVSAERVVEAARSQRLGGLFPAREANDYVEADLALYRELEPDLILMDNRLSAVVSADLAGIPRVSIMNVHMSSWRRIPFVSLRNMLNREDGSFGASLLRGADWLENRIEAVFYDRVMVPGFNQVRRRRGLKQIRGGHFEESALTLFPDVPEFNPVWRLPAHAQYVGPLTWHNDLPAPRCLRKNRLDPDRPCVYLTIGSEGLRELLADAGQLADPSVQIVVATGGDPAVRAAALPDNVFVEDFVNTDLLYGTRADGRPRVNATVCHGGNGTIYQALAAGVPIVGLATHEEQHYGLKRVEHLGLGIAFGRKTFLAGAAAQVRVALAEVLRNPRYRENAARFQVRSMSRYAAGADRAAREIERFHAARASRQAEIPEWAVA